MRGPGLIAWGMVEDKLGAVRGVGEEECVPTLRTPTLGLPTWPDPAQLLNLA